MTILNLTNQQATVTAVMPYFNGFRNEMIKRKEIWDKISPEKRVQWVKAAVLNDKDPIMKLAWTVFKDLYQNFFGLKASGVDFKDYNGEDL